MDASIVVATLAALGSGTAAWFTSRASRTAARETAASAERVEADKLRREEITQLRANLEAIIQRLTDEIGVARGEVGRLREQLDREEAVSDQLRGKVRELEEQVHRMSMTIIDLQQRLAGGAALHEEAPK
jgi:predicted nuclease with TOPRIM domain